jgi:hypothetical protein
MDLEVAAAAALVRAGAMRLESGKRPGICSHMVGATFAI